MVCRQVSLQAAILLFAVWSLFVPHTGLTHEIRPAIVDLTFTDEGIARFDITLNLEALIAEIGPEHGDTTESVNAAKYDALRLLPPAELHRQFDKFSARFLQGVFVLNQRGERLEAGIGDVVIAEVGDTDLARSSTVTVNVPLPSGTSSIIWSWAPAFGANIVRVIEPGKDDGYSVYLTGGGETEPIPLAGNLKLNAAFVLLNYLAIGFTHILPKGLDHILFVVGLFLLSTRLRPLLIQVTSFTVAHSVTLALGAMGVLTLSPTVVEPLIAASIVYVAVENILSSELHRWRPVVVFGFGLLHGLGFAGVLKEVGISDNYFVAALAAFNIGVELGQLAVILGCFLLVGFWFRGKPWYRSVITIPMSVLIALVGTYWFIQRVWFV